MELQAQLGLIFQTALTGTVGWLIKLVLDSLKSYRDESIQWRSKIDKTLTGINSALQATMRTSLLHYCEKYISRGWVTSEELASLLDMHEKYQVINPKNGFIDSLIARVQRLEIKEV